MSLVNPILGTMQRAVRDALAAHWKLFMLQGGAMIVLGILAIAAPVAATVAVDLYVGWLFLISGLFGLIALFSIKDVPAFLWSLLTAALSLAVGILLIGKPASGALSLTIVLTAFFAAEGIFQIATSVAYRHIIVDSWIWMLISGLADLALAGVIIAAWPLSAAWTLGLLAGINLLTSGYAILMVALAGRGFARAALPGVPAAG